MSISDTVKKVMPYLKTASGYVLHRLSSQAVEMDDGTTLEQKVTSLNSLISNKVDMSDVVNNCLTTEEGFVLDARQGKVLDDKITELNGKIKIVDILQCDIKYGGDGIIEGGGYHTCTGTIKSDKKISDCKFKSFFICSNYGVPMSDPTFSVRGDHDVAVQQPVQNFTDIGHSVITTIGVICYK